MKKKLSGKERMDRSSRCFLISLSIVICWILFLFHFLSTSSSSSTTSPSLLSSQSQFHHNLNVVKQQQQQQQQKEDHIIEFTPSNEHLWKPLKLLRDEDKCAGKYVYMHRLPRQYNQGMLDDCQHLSLWTNMCKFTSNAGLGPSLGLGIGQSDSGEGWYATNQFSAEVIFHNRMKNYECLTNDSSKAAAIFVPFYAGLDISRHLWGFNVSVRDEAAIAVTEWLKQQIEWKRMKGRDHFMVAGRITWDFRRKTEKEEDWGNKLLVIPEIKNITTLVIEASPWHHNDFAIPYPTYFHPSSDAQVIQWQKRLRSSARSSLFSFAGAPRQQLKTSIREQIIEQCRASSRCRLVECDFGESKCHVPSVVMQVFEGSIFCLQPQGDSFTRRSIFDSMLAGCIPVFFHPDSAYSQYTWHLPKNFRKYSVFISEISIRRENVSIEDVLASKSEEEVRGMREEVIRLIPGLLYADPRRRDDDDDERKMKMKDAFDISVGAVVEKVNKLRMRLLRGEEDEELKKLHKKEGEESDAVVGSEEAIRRWEEEAAALNNNVTQLEK